MGITEFKDIEAGGDLSDIEVEGEFSSNKKKPLTAEPREPDWVYYSDWMIPDVDTLPDADILSELSKI